MVSVCSTLEQAAWVRALALCSVVGQDTLLVTGKFNAGGNPVMD